MTSTTIRVVCLVAALAVGMTNSVWAQTLWKGLSGDGNPSEALTDASLSALPLLAQSPQGARSGRVRESRRTSGQSLILTANLATGYDDNTGATPGGAPVGVAATAGSTGFGDAMLEFNRTSSARQLTVRALGSLQMYPDYLSAPAATSKTRVAGQTRIGRSNVLRYSAQVRYEALFTADFEEERDDPAVSSASAAGAPIFIAPAVVLFERRSLVSSNKAYFETDWTKRDQTVVSYLYYKQRVVRTTEDNFYQQGAVDYERRVSRMSSLQVAYRGTSGHQTGSTAVVHPNSDQTITGGFAFDTKVLGGRPLSTRFGGGASYVENVDWTTSQPIAGWMPTGYASLGLGLARGWKATFDYGRGFSMLQGLTGSFYSTDSAAAAVSAQLTARFDVRAGTSFSNGRVALGSSRNQKFHQNGATIEAHVLVTSSLAAAFAYSSYQQRLPLTADLAPGFPARYRRDALTAGLTLWTTVAGRGRARPRAPGEW